MKANAPLEEAFRTGRTILTQFVLGAATSRMIVGKQPNRIAIAFYSQSNTYAINNRALTSDTDGIPFGLSFAKEWNQWLHGDFASQEFHVRGTNAGTIVVLEVFSECGCATGNGR